MAQNCGKVFMKEVGVSGSVQSPRGAGAESIRAPGSQASVQRNWNVHTGPGGRDQLLPWASWAGGVTGHPHTHSCTSANGPVTYIPIREMGTARPSWLSEQGMERAVPWEKSCGFRAVQRKAARGVRFHTCRGGRPGQSGGSMCRGQGKGHS